MRVIARQGVDPSAGVQQRIEEIAAAAARCMHAAGVVVDLNRMGAGDGRGILGRDAITRRGISLAATTVIPTREAVKEAVVSGLGCGFVLSGEFGGDLRLTAMELADVPDPVGV
ncbi:hypothetical protein [Roseicitreum antarcticum]|uniref:hypothetical protein n=1 Tax=Roseicitreum antarcticum TaxID=564137 RepID=UPI00159F8E21|nr:hypothetical protein [Roseicitreum antarcticum]